MQQVISKDGTSIAYDRQGSGPAVILVGGGLDDGSENAPLARELAEHYTLYNYARRGRGESGDTPPYAVEREIEDIEAFLTEAGGSAHLYGVSSGGALALEAAAAGLAANKLAVYEVPYNMADDWPRRWQEYVQQLKAVLAEDRRDDALELFMRFTGSSDEEIAGAKQSPFWAGLPGRRPAIHCPLRQDYAADPGGYRHRCASARGRGLGSGPRSGGGRDRR
jgi:pimeloyl-ACP methyl ester carboxylesterase